MRKLMILTTAALLAGTSLAMAQAGGGGGEPPKASDANPPAAIQGTPGEARSAPAQGTQAPDTMQTRDSGMPAGANNSTGNMNTKGTGPGNDRHRRARRKR